MRLAVCYDLALCPPTYDFTGFLLWAESERLARGAEDLSITIAPGPKGGFRDDALPPFDVAERVAMLENIVLPMARLLPSCRGVTLARRREDIPVGAIGQGVRHYGLSVMVEAFERGIFPLRAEPFLQGAPYATITLREAAYWPTRNSSLPEWLRVADWLKSHGVPVLIIRDAAMSTVEIFSHAVCAGASHDLAARAALYAGAELNLFVNNGPAWMCLAMGLPTLVTKLVADGAPCVSEAYFAAHGLPPGQQPGWARPRQRFVWDDDRADAVIAAAEEVLAA